MAKPIDQSLQGPGDASSVGGLIAGADTSTAQTIQLGVKTGVAVATEVKRGQLQRGLNELGQEVKAAELGETEFKESTQRFKDLAAAKAQGSLTQTYINIQAEKVLKETIGAFPMFGDALRKEAAVWLGFDPTGSQLKAMFTSTDGKERKQTPFEKMQSEAFAIAQATGSNPDNILRLMGQKQKRDLESSLIGSTEVINDHSADQLFQVEVTGQGNLAAVQAMAHVAQSIEQGGTAKPEELAAKLSQVPMSLMANYQAKALEKGIILTPEKISAQSKVINEQFQPIIDLANDGTLQKMKARERDTMMSYLAIEGVKAFPVTAMMKAAGGDGAVSTYWQTLADTTDPAQLNLLKEHIPALQMIDTHGDAFKANVMKGLNRILGYDSTTASTDEERLAEQLAARNLAKASKDKASSLALLKHYQAKGAVIQSVLDYGQKGARANATPEVVQYMKDRYETDFVELQSTLVSSLSGTRHELVTTAEGDLRITAPPQSLRGGRSHRKLAVPSEMQLQLKSLNGFLKAARNGYAGDFGVDAKALTDQTLQSMTGKRNAIEESNKVLDAAVQKFRDSPSTDNFAELESLNPELAEKVRAKVLQRSKGRAARADKAKRENRDG